MLSFEYFSYRHKIASIEGNEHTLLDSPPKREYSLPIEKTSTPNKDVISSPVRYLTLQLLKFLMITNVFRRRFVRRILELPFKLLEVTNRIVTSITCFFQRKCITKGYRFFCEDL